MTTHEINLLIERYLDGETTPAEERALALAVQREDRPAEWAIIAEMLGELTVDEELYDSIMAQRAPKPAKQVRPTVTQLVKLWPWAAAACVVLAMGLSYNIINKPPQETAKTEQPLPVQPQPENMPATKPLLAEHPKPLVEKPIPPVEQPLVKEPPFEAQLAESLPEAQTEKPLPETQTEEPFPEPQPQLIAEEETLPPQEDFALCMALIAEVEARAVQVEQSEQQLYQDLLDELLAYIQQQSNRPELSL